MVTSTDGKDFIAIPTCNRVSALAACAACLSDVRGLDACRIFVRDDASSEFDQAVLANLFPRAERIDRNTENLGVTANQMLLYRTCIEAGASRILVLDSDMILSPSALEFARGAFERTDGVLGLYNSILHEEMQVIDAHLVEKRSFGGAATFWDAALLGAVIDRMENRAAWDWEAVALLKETGRRVVVSRRSYAQHLGIAGRHNRWFGSIDYGRGFLVETENQARVMADTLTTLLANQHTFIRPKRERAPLKRLARSLRRRLLS
jgi:hypothetical protein